MNPLVELDEAGRVVQVTFTAAPDREPFTEFYAGLLVVGLDNVHTEELLHCLQPLTEWLPSRLTDSSELYLLTGLDFRTLCTTPQTRIQRIGAEGAPIGI